jgi:type 1 glutamine amidotransferase
VLSSFTRAARRFHTSSFSRMLFAAGLAAATAQAAAPFKVLGLFRAGYDAAHINYAHEANAWFPKVAAENGFQYDSSKNWDLLNDATLNQKYQVVMFIDDQPSSNQHAGFQRYMENGGGFIGYHVSAFTTNSAGWDWYHNKFLGSGNFRSNTWGPTPAQMKVEDPTHPVTLGFPTVFKSETSEWYNWTNDLRKNPDIKVLCSIDPSSYPLGTDPNQSWRSGDNPIVWTNKKYKMIYCNSGHNDMDYAANKAKSLTFDNAQHRTLILNALKWLAGQPTTSIGGNFANAARDARLDVRWSGTGLDVSQPGLNAFGISILDLQGNRIAEGSTATGMVSLERARLKSGFYVIQSTSSAGKTAQTLRVH